MSFALVFVSFLGERPSSLRAAALSPVLAVLAARAVLYFGMPLRFPL